MHNRAAHLFVVSGVIGWLPRLFCRKHALDLKLPRSNVVRLISTVFTPFRPKTRGTRTVQPKPVSWRSHSFLGFGLGLSGCVFDVKQLIQPPWRNVEGELYEVGPVHYRAVHTDFDASHAFAYFPDLKF